MFAELFPRLGKIEILFSLLFACNYVVYVRRVFVFLLVLEIVCVILLWRSLGLQYHYLHVFACCSMSLLNMYNINDIVLDSKLLVQNHPVHTLIRVS